MRVAVARVVLTLLALTSIVVFFLEINSARNDATHIAQACVVAFAVFAMLGWISGRSRS